MAKDRSNEQLDPERTHLCRTLVPVDVLPSTDSSATKILTIPAGSLFYSYIHHYYTQDYFYIHNHHICDYLFMLRTSDWDWTWDLARRNSVWNSHEEELCVLWNWPRERVGDDPNRRSNVLRTCIDLSLPASYRQYVWMNEWMNEWIRSIVAMKMMITTSLTI